jgi:hypothetical protein
VFPRAREAGCFLRKSWVIATVLFAIANADLVTITPPVGESEKATEGFGADTQLRQAPVVKVHKIASGKPHGNGRAFLHTIWQWFGDNANA